MRVPILISAILSEESRAVSASLPNTFLSASIGGLYARTALPIIFVMSLNGLIAIVDALFLGYFVGAAALAAITAVFPAYILIGAIATLVSSGMSSVLARHLGAGHIEAARSIFAGAHGLALLASGGLILLFLIFGPWFTTTITGGSEELDGMALTYLRITVLFSPVLYILSVNSDALRNEGRIGLMTVVSLLISIANIGFNYLFIAQMGLGVSGSAYGTVAAQSLAFVVLLTFRFRSDTQLAPSALAQGRLTYGWRRILVLGAPQSLNFVGLALGSAAIIAALQLSGTPHFVDTMSAYGIITRVLTFSFFPLLGLSHAMQTIIGNNFGARNWHRSDSSLKFAIFAALVYCVTAQAAMSIFAGQIGSAFVSDAGVVTEVGRILPTLTAMFFLTGPLMMIASYFQTIGDAKRAAVLSLSKPYFFTIPLTFALVLAFGEKGIWFAAPAAEGLLLGLTGLVLAQTMRARKLRWGLLHDRVGTQP